MRRLLRWAFNLAAAVSATVFLVICAVWLVSLITAHEWAVVGVQPNGQLERWSVKIVPSRIVLSDQWQLDYSSHWSTTRFEHVRNPSHVKGLIWDNRNQRYVNPRSGFFHTDLVLPELPIALLALLVSALPWFRVLISQRFRRAREVGRRPCPSCGYDLRASPGRCPECGMVPKDVPMSI